MAKATGPRSDQIDGAVKFYVAVPAQADLGRVPEVFGSEDANWLGQRVPEDASDITGHTLDRALLHIAARGTAR